MAALATSRHPGRAPARVADKVAMECQVAALVHKPDRPGNLLATPLHNHVASANNLEALLNSIAVQADEPTSTACQAVAGVREVLRVCREGCHRVSCLAVKEVRLAAWVTLGTSRRGLLVVVTKTRFGFLAVEALASLDRHPDADMSRRWYVQVAMEIVVLPVPGRGKVQASGSQTCIL